MLYQIKDWEKHFESAKSKTFNKCTHAYIPNQQTGDGYVFILSQPDGGCIYGCWQMLVMACSLQDRPRQGYCTDNGRPDGEPWTTTILALKWRRTEKEVKRMLDVISSPPVSWIIKDTIGIPQDPIGSSDNDIRLDIRPETAFVSPQKRPVAQPKSPLIVFPTAGNITEWHLTQEMVDLYKTAYPAVDIIGECRKALVWVNCNSRKTSKGMKRFLNRWLGKAQDGYHGGGNGTNRGNTQTRAGFQDPGHAKDYADLAARAIQM